MSKALLDSVQTTGSSAVGFQSESGADGLPTAPNRHVCRPETQCSAFLTWVAPVSGFRSSLCGEGVLPQYSFMFRFCPFFFF